jgi:ABC-type thiamine transport system ATPase subunit
LVIDESFKFLSKDLSCHFFEFLSKVSKETGIQLILISHDPNTDYEDTQQFIDSIYTLLPDAEKGVTTMRIKG